MAQDSSQFLVGGAADLYVGDVGTTAPTDTTTALDAGFVNVGYTTDDGISISPSFDTNSIMSNQSFYPTARLRTGADLTISATLQQINQETFTLAFGGGSFTETPASSGNWVYTAPDPETIDYRAIVIHVVNGSKILRIHVPKVMVTDIGDLTFSKDDTANLDLTFGLVATGVGAAWTVIGNTAALPAS